MASVDPWVSSSANKVYEEEGGEKERSEEIVKLCFIIMTEKKKRQPRECGR